MYIPEGYGTLFPYFVVTDGDRFAKFLSNAFGAKEVGRTVMPDGRAANIRIRIGTSTFMVAEEQEGVPATRGAYYLYVENADDTCARALAHGATKIFDPMDMPYQDRQGGIVDPFGNQWWISTRLVKHSYDE
jgi:PhnB protein